jgi:hypothetical protein
VARKGASGLAATKYQRLQTKPVKKTRSTKAAAGGTEWFMAAALFNLKNGKLTHRVVPKLVLVSAEKNDLTVELMKVTSAETKYETPRFANEEEKQKIDNALQKWASEMQQEAEEHATAQKQAMRELEARQKTKKQLDKAKREKRKKAKQQAKASRTSVENYTLENDSEPSKNAKKSQSNDSGEVYVERGEYEKEKKRTMMNKPKKTEKKMIASSSDSSDDESKSCEKKNVGKH